MVIEYQVVHNNMENNKIYSDNWDIVLIKYMAVYLGFIYKQKYDIFFPPNKISQFQNKLLTVFFVE